MTPVHNCNGSKRSSSSVVKSGFLRLLIVALTLFLALTTPYRCVTAISVS